MRNDAYRSAPLWSTAGGPSSPLMTGLVHTRVPSVPHPSLPAPPQWRRGRWQARARHTVVLAGPPPLPRSLHPPWGCPIHRGSPPPPAPGGVGPVPARGPGRRAKCIASRMAGMPGHRRRQGEGVTCITPVRGFFQVYFQSWCVLRCPWFLSQPGQTTVPQSHSPQRLAGARARPTPLPPAVPVGAGGVHRGPRGGERGRRGRRGGPLPRRRRRPGLAPPTDGARVSECPRRWRARAPPPHQTDGTGSGGGGSGPGIQDVAMDRGGGGEGCLSPSVAAGGGPTGTRSW